MVSILKVLLRPFVLIYLKSKKSQMAKQLDCDLYKISGMLRNYRESIQGIAYDIIKLL